MKCLIVLSHLMSENCYLGIESIARSKLAIEKFSSNDYDLLITIGWAYRVDCAIPIADVVKKYILKNSNIEKRYITSLTSSRDTVGDAYYCLDYFRDAPLSELHIITSDYHVERVKIIFKAIFNNRLKIKVFGAKTEVSNDSAVLQHEKKIN